MKKQFILYSSCIPIKGYKRSILCDLQKNNFLFITHDLFKIFNYNNTIIVNNSNKELLEFLSYQGFGIITYQNINLKKISFKNYNDYPSKISNSIIEIAPNSELDLTKIIKQLSDLHCSAIELKYYNILPVNFPDDLNSFNNSTIRSISICIPYQKNITVIIKQLLIFDKVKKIIIYNSPNNNIESIDLYTKIIYLTQDISSKTCGFISPINFKSNILFYNDSLYNNTCLNKKISIDANGEIKNCPSMTESYGNIKNTSLEQALNHPHFKKLWNITKDHIEICKDCEFRYICMDCRAYIEDPDNIYSKPLKCGYNPYTAKWEKWSNNPLKQKAIQHYENSL